VQDDVKRAIATMWSRYPDDLSLDAMADAAHLSRFYFSRLFRTTIGTSPGRFLSAIRLYQAQDMLVETTASVTDIAHGVGYNSLGAFISRFTRSVGSPPGRYRRESQLALQPGSGRRAETVRGSVLMPPDFTAARVHIGVFTSPLISDDPPAAADVLYGGGEFVLPGVPERTWYIRAAIVPAGDSTDARSWCPAPAMMVGFGPVRVRAGMVTSINLEPHPMSGVVLPVRADWLAGAWPAPVAA
jgi:AraC-like DNA-binding protein